LDASHYRRLAELVFVGSFHEKWNQLKNKLLSLSGKPTWSQATHKERFEFVQHSVLLLCCVACFFPLPASQ